MIHTNTHINIPVNQEHYMPSRKNSPFFKKTLYPILLCLTWASAVHATEEDSLKPQTVTATDAFKDFLKCDASFFMTLKNNPTVLGQNIKVVERAHAAVPEVMDPLYEKGHQQIFEKPVTLGNLSLHGWHNEVMHDVNDGSFLFWGFIVNGETNQVAQEINRLLPEDRQVKNVGPVWARPEMRLVGDPINVFRKGGVHGKVTDKGTVERVLLVEGDPGASPPRTKIFCSLQGSLSPILLKSIRPDLIEKEYP